MMTFAKALILIGLLATLCVAPYTVAQTGSTQILLERARSLESSGHIDLAARVWKQVLLSEPNTVEALTGLARYAEQEGNSKEAEQYLEKAKVIDPGATASRPAAPSSRGTADSSILSPDQSSKLQEAARLSANQKPEEAMKLYREVFKDHPPDGDLALAYYETLASTPGGREIAIPRLNELANRHPEDAQYRLAAARLLTYARQTRAQGLRELEAIRGNAAVMNEVRSAWRQTLVWEKGNPAYAESLQRYLALYPDTELDSEFGPLRAQRRPEEIVRDNEEQAAFKALGQGNMADAEQRFEKLRATAPDDPRTLMGLGFVRMKQERFAEAVALLEAAAASSPQKDKNLLQALETARFWKNMQEGTLLLEQDHFEQASASFHQALLLRPDNPDATRGLAGTLMKSGEYAEAITMYQTLLKKNGEDLDAWRSLLRGLQQSGDSAGAIAAAKAMPPKVRALSADDPEVLVVLAAAYETTGGTAQSRQLLERAIERSGRSRASAGTQMEMASLLAQAGMLTQATEMYVRLADQNPQNLDIWRGLIAALHSGDRDAQALAVSQRMPRTLFQDATNKPDFLMLMASIYESQGQLESAHRFLEQAVQIETSDGKEISIRLALQVAGLWLQEKEYSQAADAFDRVIRRSKENPDAWRGKLTALHMAKRDDEVVADFAAMDPALRDRLLNDPILSGLLAGAYAAEGQGEIALRMIRRTAWQYESMRKPLPVDLQVQTCWILMDAGEDANLFSELRVLSARRDLTPAQTTSVEQIWVAWSQKRSERLASLGEYHEALSVLYAARRAFPDDLPLRASFANMLLRAGYTRRSYEDYLSWGLVGGTRDDYLSGIGAAMSVREFKTADVWLQTALREWPDDPKVLLAGAKLAAARGDLGRANKYYQAAKAAYPSRQQGDAGLHGDENPQAQGQAVRELADLLAPPDSHSRSGAVAPAAGVPARDNIDNLLSGLPGAGGDFSPRPIRPNHAIETPGPNGFEQSLPWDTSTTPEPLGTSSAQVRISPSNAPTTHRDDSLDWFLHADPSGQAITQKAPRYSQDLLAVPSSNPTPANLLDPVTSLQSDGYYLPGRTVGNPGSSVLGTSSPSSPHSEVESEINAMYAQFSPYIGMGGYVMGRSGQTGFDHLIAQESDLEASTTFSNEVRLTAIAKPVMLDAGAPTGNTTLQLGTLAQGTSFAALSAAGLGGEVQVATQNFDARFGVTPQGFLVSNFLGDVDFRPAGGPIQISLTRDPVRDTLLSYAGVRDPGTSQVWGGVIANGVSGTASWNMTGSGLYAELGYQYITGDQVLTNHRIDGTTGAYWSVLTRPYGSLALGINMSAMHYDENLRYFTFGQGGYFSPQSYFLFNVPLHWKGTYHNRFEYSVDASLGSQHFSEDATPYYPLEANSKASSAVATVAPTNSAPSLIRFKNPTPTPPTPTPPSFVMPYYPSQTVTSVNYSLTMKGGYRLTENWFLGGFMNVNNARDYSSSSVGICVRYQQRPVSLDTPLNDADVQQWNSIRKLVLP